MKFIACFTDDPLPPDGKPCYSCRGPAVWLDASGKPHQGMYDPSIVLPLVEMSPEQLEEVAARIMAEWGDPGMDPEYSTRHPHRDGKHNLLLYRLRSKPTVLN